MRLVRLVPSPPIRVDGRDLDAVVVEIDDAASSLDVRLELGRGLAIDWALPASPNGPLRLAYVDSAVMHVDEPELLASPWRADVPRTTWTGELGRLGNGHTLVEVSIEVVSRPASYRFELVTQDPSGTRDTTILHWTEPGDPHGPTPRR